MRIATVIAFVQFTNALEYMVFNPIFVFMATDFAVPVSFSGYVSGIYTLGAVLSGIIAFYWIDHFNKKQFLIINMALLGLLTLLTTCTSSFSLLLALRFCAGLVGGTTMGVGISILINNAPPNLRGKMLATVIASFSIVSIVGMPTIELLEIGKDKEKLLLLENDNILTDEELNNMHGWELNTESDVEQLNSWVNFLKKYNVFYSNPLDLDFLMLTHFQEFYKKAIPENGGPRIPDKTIELDKFQEKVKTAVQATLKSEQATAVTYSNEDKELMIWYNYHFLGRGKPVTHIQVLSSMTDSEIKANLPEVFQEIFKKIILLLNAE